MFVKKHFVIGITIITQNKYLYDDCDTTAEWFR